MITDKELIKQEIFKCSRDYVYLLKKYGKIVIPGKGLFNFNLYSFQEKVLSTFQNEKDCIILKGRQLGMSTLVAGYIACSMIFGKRFEALIIATKQDKAIHMIRKIKVILKNFPKWMLDVLNANIKIDNAKSIELYNGSLAKAEAYGSDIGRSEGLALLVIDEAAFIRKLDELWAGLSETLSTTGGKTIILSTPKGVGNWFHKTYIEAEEGLNGFYSMKIPWYFHPYRDENWKKERIQKLGEQKFAQEHDCSFISSGRTIIPGKIIQEYEKICKEPIEKIGFENNLWIWKWPLNNKKYIISADVATEGGADWSACHIIDLETCEQVGEFKGHIQPADFGNMLVSLGYQYNEAMLVIENNSLGIATIQPALDKNYRNLLWTIRGGVEYIDPINNPYALNNKEARPGFSTTRRTRPLMIQKLEDYLLESSININSKRTVDELWTFVYEGGRIQALQGYHDDLLMALSMALWTRDTVIKLKSLTDEFDRKRANWILKSNASSSQAIYMGQNIQEDPYNMIIDGKNEDLRWLL